MEIALDRCDLWPAYNIPICDAGSEISDIFQCTKQYSLTCQWAKERKENTMKFFIAGVKFHNYKSILSDITEGDNLVLFPEPENKFDPNAVQIHFDNGGKAAFLGFVPKKFSSEVAGLLEIGRPLECVLTKFNPGATTWEMFECEVREIKESE
uniref:Putative HIRAN domain containing protein n=1 Tax=viral metagenome TaxID=1070528 RepID=A0A6M3XFL8_9ZZZZ